MNLKSIIGGLFMTTEQKLKKQEETISSLTRRVSELVDRFMILEADIGYFKRTVAGDLKEVNEVLKTRTRQ